MRRVLATLAISLAGLASLTFPGLAQQPAKADAPPAFQPEPFWPKPLPENWILGQVAGIATAPNGNIWILHRPASLVDDEKGAQKNPPEIQMLQGGASRHGVRHRRQSAAPLGRPGRRQNWVKNEHGLHIDRRRQRLGRRQQ